MRPVQLIMSAFGSYADREIIDFSHLENGLFLISGDTGSGKTTIFDGIVYALYDRTSGGIRDGNMMRCVNAGPGTPTYVEFVFLCKGEKYRIVRNPDYERESLRRDKNGNLKMTQEKSKVELYLSDGSLFRENKKETNRKIEEIIGLDAKQFMQVAMIAQGDFLKLLHAKSEERKEIFSRIFDTGIYAGMQRELRQREKECAMLLKEREQAFSEQVSRIAVPPEWEKAREAEEILSSRVPEQILSLLEEINAYGEKEVQFLFQKRETSREKVKMLEEKRKGLKELADLLERKLSRQAWLDENADTEQQLLQKEAEKQRALEKQEALLGNLNLLTEQMSAAYQAEKNQLEENEKELDALQAMLEKMEYLGRTKEKKAQQWQAARTDYQKANARYETLYEGFFKEQAGILAAELTEGKPCPVCGSIHHPQKAPVSEHAPTQLQVQYAREALQEASGQQEKCQTKYLEAAQQYQASLGSLEQEGKRLLGSDFSAENPDYQEQIREAVKKAADRLNLCEKQYKVNRQQREKELRECMRSCAAYKKNLSEIQKKREEFIRLWERTKGEQAADQEREKLLRKQNRTVEEIAKEADAAAQNEKTAKAEEKTADVAYQKGYSRQQSNEKIMEILKEYQEDFCKKREEYVQIRHLSQTACGTLSGSVKMDFESFIQRKYFQQVVWFANRRLEKMSSGQFLLKCREMDRLGGRARTGLELDVYSLLTGSVRDVKTLSGGESFMAALSLALGMSDAIRSTAGGIQLETLFIDEGFGALDENAREQAVRVLEQLSGENRLTGIISHVPELKEQIEARLLISKDRNGSHVRWLDGR